MFSVVSEWELDSNGDPENFEPPSLRFLLRLFFLLTLGLLPFFAVCALTTKFTVYRLLWTALLALLFFACPLQSE